MEKNNKKTSTSNICICGHSKEEHIEDNTCPLPCHHYELINGEKIFSCLCKKYIPRKLKESKRE